MEIPKEYQETIRRCKLTILPGPASDPKDVVEVDWSGELGTNPANFLLGWEPRGNPLPYWIDESLQYAPPPAWAQSDTYITALELENAALKAQLNQK